MPSGRSVTACARRCARRAAPFGAPEDVSDLDRARLPDVAFDPIGHRWTAVWSQRIGPDQGVPLTQITTFLRSSTRPG